MLKIALFAYQIQKKIFVGDILVLVIVEEITGKK
jgi:hypothetical protein